MKEQKNVEKAVTPPYVSYVTFRNFLDQMHSQIVPKQIDRSVLPSMAGGQFSQLMQALRYLGLVGEDGTTDPYLENLAKSEGDERKDILRQLVNSHYGALFGSKGKNIDLTKETRTSLLKRFLGTGTTSLVANKCLLFFLNIASDSGIEIPDHIKPPRQHIVRNRAKTRGERKQKGDDKIRDEFTGSGDDETLDQALTFEQMQKQKLLAKFPDFDPAWDSEMKAEWFKQYREMWGLFKENETKPE